MVSIGPNSQSMNFTHMFDMPDLRGPLPVLAHNLYSLSYYLDLSTDFTKFHYILKLSGMEGLYDDPQANMTLLVPRDDKLQHIPDEVFINMDKGTARSIIKCSTLDRKITGAILEDSPSSYFMTKLPAGRLFVTNMNGKTYINTNIQVIEKDLDAVNGTVHVIDNLIWPDIPYTI